MAAPALPPPFHSLNDQPRLNFAEFELQVIDDAGSACLAIFPHGLLSCVYGRHFPTTPTSSKELLPFSHATHFSNHRNLPIRLTSLKLEISTSNINQILH